MIVPYENKLHYEKLSQWLAHKQIPAPDTSFFSESGFVVNEIAIGFLFKGGNSKTCYIDHVAADPEASRADRSHALDILFDHIQKIATEDGYKLLTVVTSQPSLKERFKKHSFHPFQELTLLFKVLGD